MKSIGMSNKMRFVGKGVKFERIVSVGAYMGARKAWFVLIKHHTQL